MEALQNCKIVRFVDIGLFGARGGLTEVTEVGLLFFCHSHCAALHYGDGLQRLAPFIAFGVSLGLVGAPGTRLTTVALVSSWLDRLR